MDYHTRIRNIREDLDYTQAEIGKLLSKSQQGYNQQQAYNQYLRNKILTASPGELTNVG